MARSYWERVFETINFNPTAPPGDSTSNTGTWREMFNRILYNQGVIKGTTNWYDAAPTNLATTNTHINDTTGAAHGGSYVEIRDHGTPVTKTRILDILGTGATLAHNSGGNKTDLTITGGGGGGGVDHNILSATHLDSNASDTPVNGEALLRSGGQWQSAPITATNVASASVDGTAGTASMRTLGTGAQQAAAGTDSRFHSQTHALLGSDHTDVTVSTPTHDDVLGYDGPSSKWVAIPNPAASVYVSPALMEGLTPRWDGANTITITSGAAWVPGTTNKVVELSADFQRPVSFPASSTAWHYLYLYEATPGVGGVELSTIAPVAYHGNAKSQTGDTAGRRYLGAILPNGAAVAAMYKFTWSGDRVMYLENLFNSPFRYTGNSTTETSLNFSTAVPPTATAAQLFVANNSTTQFANFGTPDDTFVAGSGSWFMWLDVQDNVCATIPLPSSTKALNFRLTGSSAAGVEVGVQGYVESR